MVVSKLKKTFSDRFYLEIQRHGDLSEKNIENIYITLSNKFKIPLIASQEIFYIDKDMYEAHDALLCIGEKTYIDENNRKKFSDQHFIKSTTEMEKLFKDLPEALENNYNFPFRFNYKLKKSEPVLPSLNISSNLSEKEELLALSKSGLKNRLENFVFKKNQSLKREQLESIYSERLLHEIKIINKMNYAGYFLIVSDYIKWAKKNNIPVGPGRGSGAGSLVAYSLDITDLDPIEFGLIFERFLNPDRISMPDFDIDFCEEKRDLIFKYLKSKYKGWCCTYKYIWETQG
jgi:DNA polymerase III, alpha subunit